MLVMIKEKLTFGFRTVFLDELSNFWLLKKFFATGVG
jgi:hypothetical protein